jgi:hypothetical protein
MQDLEALTAVLPKFEVFHAVTFTVVEYSGKLKGF